MVEYEHDVKPEKMSKDEEKRLEKVAKIVDTGLRAVEAAVEEVCGGELHLIHAAVFASISQRKPEEGDDVRDFDLAESCAAYGVGDTMVPLVLHYLETVARSEGGGFIRVPIGRLDTHGTHNPEGMNYPETG